MRSRLALWALWALLAWLVLGCYAPARADTELALAQSFSGRLNFTGTQVSLRTKPNNRDACAVSSSSTNRSASLVLPAGATVVSAQLYWAGSGASDSTVSFQGKPVSATRTYSSATVGYGFNYFGGAADVTAVVKAKGSGTYNFSGLTISIGSPWCPSQAVLGGFSLLVVYSHPNEPQRVLNLYEGFRHVQDSEITVTATNFRWPSLYFPVRERARVGHITWEGDPKLAQDGERLLFEGTEMSDSFNPEGNQFNSSSNINGDNSSYGIDFDAYDTSVIIWAGYAPRVTTRYRTGQDLVLLNAEILLVPSLPVADLSVALARSGELRVNEYGRYAVTVTNNGPWTEAGRVTVTTTLPAGLVFVSGSGTGWSCTDSGAAVSCIYSGTLAYGKAAPVLTLTTSVKTTGEKLVKVLVKGSDDDNAANNEASDTAIAQPATVTTNPTPGELPGVAKYVFTAAACEPGKLAGTECPFFSGPIEGVPATVHVTAIDSAGKALAAPASVSFKFALRCLNPEATAGIKARLGALELPVCAASLQGALPAEAWSTAASVSFETGKASAALAFSYADVGKVELHLLHGTTPGTPATFVSKPFGLEFRSVTREGVAAPADSSPAGPGFAMAGEPVQVAIGARVKNALGETVVAPNFGLETTVPTPTLTNVVLYPNLASQPALAVDPAWQKGSAGTVTTNASWSEVGSTTFVAKLDDYLGAGEVAGEVRKNVGRFYPAYFSTEIDAPFACPADLVCASRDDETPIGIAYAGQPFPARVVPHDANDQPLANFTGDWFRPVTLSVTGAGGNAPAGTLAPTLLAAGGEATLAYTLPQVFDPDARRGAPTAPTTVFLRARADNTRVTAAGSEPAPILSDRSPAASSEDGLVVVNGRLRVANALGTDTLRTPLRLRAEYWTGAAWRGHAAYDDPAGVDAALAIFRDCTRTLAGQGTPCNAALVGVTAPQAVRLQGGTGVLWLRAPGKQADGSSRDGAIGVRFPGWPWLPSTAARVSFGRHRSPVIYLREIY